MLFIAMMSAARLVMSDHPLEGTARGAAINLHSHSGATGLQEARAPPAVQTLAAIKFHSQEQEAPTVRNERPVDETFARQGQNQRAAIPRPVSAMAAITPGTVRSVEVAPSVRRSVPVSVSISANGDSVQLAGEPAGPADVNKRAPQSSENAPVASMTRESKVSSSSIITWLLFIVAGVVFAWALWTGWAAWRRFKIQRNSLNTNPQNAKTLNLQKDRLLKNKPSLTSDQSSGETAETSTSEEAAQIYARVQKSLEHLKLAGKNGKARAGQPHQGISAGSKSAASDASTRS